MSSVVQQFRFGGDELLLGERAHRLQIGELVEAADKVVGIAVSSPVRVWTSAARGWLEIVAAASSSWRLWRPRIKADASPTNRTFRRTRPFLPLRRSRNRCDRRSATCRKRTASGPRFATHLLRRAFEIA